MVALRRAISCCARPRLFTSSILRSDSVVAPASAVVSRTMCFCTSLILRLSTLLNPPSSGTVSRYAGTTLQCTREA